MSMRVALLHFTADPCIGGVEQIIESQRRALRRMGHDVRLIVGKGGSGTGLERIPAMQPPDARHVSVPSPDDPNVRSLERALEAALEGIDAAWVHNILTVYLQPTLTVALLRLMSRRRDVRWVAFCHDLTAVSSFWRSLSPADAARLRLPDDIDYVVDSSARRRDLLAHGLREQAVRVLPPPLDTSWLGIGQEARRIVEHAGLEDGALILVPSKLLPHKNLEAAVRLASALSRYSETIHLLITGAPSPHEPGDSRRVHESLLNLAERLGVSDRLGIVSDLIGRPPGRRAVRDLMLLADLVFVPSAEEGFGLPLQEAMALRVPLLCSDIPPFREVADGCAQYFPLGSSAEQLGEMALAILRTPAAMSRRHVLRSHSAYAQALARLCDAGSR